ncbi:hypothetical protein A3D71_04365 [Candidatus Kaiserbacteria bacterium RIFCSPHIGHO2_02_FULL_55_20]|uniref:Response regulatory domain-containing protein n=1 Tax=Candidatus Kaiserbacteria bacterium RIFCSPHIGHO2_02_FULL_55_20 TaxID=1798497 RepID=A0A1F6DV43_9BACT|nr:MAG: hypothetical protein A2680_03785 [Candidatus Kaiserbacteria bacterium RIFCSPHIGHO2_01_FULL_55_37]OGG65253.1 MAG: hypothetical protein A3D71_04365 [Candidatus Kaiserbacteria bacterium RIFCSPHIGHO2_02_FULL_55_20]
MPEKKKVLMIDDDGFFTSIIANAFKKHGCEIRSARDGESGIESARKERPDLVLLDMAMVGMDGFETLSTLKNDPATASIPIIIFSGSAGSSDTEKHEQAKLAGAADFLEKMQFTPEQLWERVKGLLGSSR